MLGVIGFLVVQDYWYEDTILVEVLDDLVEAILEAEEHYHGRNSCNTEVYALVLGEEPTLIGHWSGATWYWEDDN